jgi:propionyl-CoA carboxylase alpha chain
VAAGEKLPFRQADVKRNGWAIECRINAEDPFRNFLPSTGRLVRYMPPRTTMEAAMPMPVGGGVRVDTGVYEGGEIPMYYDSMIAKLVVHGLDRDDAIRRMREALNGFVIRGVASNIPFQAALLARASARRTCRTTTRTSSSRWQPRRTGATASARQTSPASCRATR